jgi:hypothetical protein
MADKVADCTGVPPWPQVESMRGIKPLTSINARADANPQAGTESSEESLR